MTSPCGRRALTAAVAGLAVAVALGALLSAARRSAASPQKRPNIVVIVTDDQTLASLTSTTMPSTVGLMRQGGTEFTNAVATTPVCCPSRATLLTGQYAHNHGTLANTPGYAALRDKANTLPVWLGRAGYVTAHVGKYLNRYKASVDDPADVAPGWDEWHTVLDPARKYVRYYGYRLAENGELRRVGKRPRDYITRVINRRAVDMVREYAPGRSPLYLQVDHRAPHTEAGVDSGGPCGGLVPPDPRDATAFATAPLPRPPSFDEEDVSDKPSFIRDLPRLDPTTTATIEQRYRCALASLLAVDRGVAKIVAALRRTKELDDTVVAFTSDNGFFFGEHRIPEQKTRPYEEALRVPLLIRVPDRYRGGAPVVPLVQEPVANIDLAPTILDLAGARPCRSAGRCRVLDGRSLTGLLRGDSEWPGDRAVLIEFDAGERARRAKVCRYQGVRAADQVYVRHTAAADPATGLCEPIDEVEHYGLAADPDQLDNLHPADTAAPASPAEAQMQERLEELGECAGIAGRDAPLAGRSPCE
ncbi:MAG TPA: sulfatase [Solirubrobacterales bacterium]|nr:sulfatase [Solirubrobacterales bacterium]